MYSIRFHFSNRIFYTILVELRIPIYSSMLLSKHKLIFQRAGIIKTEISTANFKNGYRALSALVYLKNFIKYLGLAQSISSKRYSL